MSYTLKDFNGRFHAMPNIVLDFLPCDIYVTFAQIHASSKKALFDGKITMSQNALTKLTGMSWRKISKCLNDLQDINFIQIISDHGKTTTFKINWEEIYEIGKFSANISYDGKCAIRNLCFSRNGIIPFSELDQATLDSVYQKYSSEKIQQLKNDNEELYETSTSDILDKIKEITEVGLKNGESTSDICAKIAEMLEVKISINESTSDICAKNTKKLEVDTGTSDFSAQNAGMSEVTGINHIPTSDIPAKNDKMTEVACNQSSHFITKQGEKYRISVLLSNAESLLLNLINAQMSEVALISPPTSDFSAQTSVIFAPTSVIANCNELKNRELQTPKDNKDNKDNKDINITSERSEEYIGREEKKTFLEDDFDSRLKNDFNSGKRTSSDKYKNIRAWALERDCDKYDPLPEYELENIIANPNFYSSDSDKLIRAMWHDLEGTSKDAIDDNSQNSENIIPVALFRQMLYQVMEELKEQDMNFSLTEEQAKSIFGFELTSNEDNEPQYVITSSSLRNIESPAAKALTKRKNKSRAEERVKNMVYMDCLQHIANTDLDSLTSIEYAILLMIDYVADRKDNQQPYPDEVTKAVYANLLVEFAEKASCSKNDLRILWKELPSKGNKVHLHPQQLLVDKIIQYNSEHNEASKVEKMWKQKMAEKQ